MILIPFIILSIIILLINKPKPKLRIGKERNYDTIPDIKVGDYVSTDLPNLQDRIDGYYKVLKIRKVDWSKCSYNEGDALTLEHQNGEFWSKYFYKK